MKKSNLLLLVLCTHITYVSHAGDDQLLQQEPQQEQLVAQAPSSDQSSDSSAEQPVQEQNLDQLEPREGQAEISVQQEQSVQDLASARVAEQPASSIDTLPSASTDNATVISQQDISAPQEEPTSGLSSCVTTIAAYSKLQLTALTAGGALMGYGCYKAYTAVVDWYYPQEQEKEQAMTLSAKDRDLLLNFAEVMAQDVRQARTAGKRKASLVQKFDISGLSMPLLIECNYIQSDFVKLYHQCDDEGNGIEVLNLFYCEFNHALKELIDQAQIV